MNHKVVIFDLDGVLFDSSQLVNDFLMETYPTMTKEIVDDILCGNFHEELAQFKLTNPVKNETPEELEARRSQYAENKSKAPLYKGIRELLEKLHSKGYILTINTSATDKNCLPLLENSNIRHLFDFVATAELSKSKVEKFRIIEQKYHVSKKGIVFVTDTLGDIREADIAQIPTIAVLWGAQAKERLMGEAHENVVAVVESVEDLENRLFQ